jgi:hypothetical protein
MLVICSFTETILLTTYYKYVSSIALGCHGIRYSLICV